MPEPKRILFTLLIFLLSVSQATNAQQSKIDSLIAIDNDHPAKDSLKVENIRRIFRQYLRMGMKDKVDEYEAKTIRTANTINKKIEALNYFRLAMSYHGVSDYLPAIENYKKALQLYNETGNKRMIGSTYLNMGALYIDIPDYAKSLEAHQKAMEIFRELHNNEALSSCYYNIGEIYEGLNENVKALEYIEKALKIFQLGSPAERGIPVAYNAMGLIYLSLSDNDMKKLNVPGTEKYKRALDFLFRALPVSKSIRDNDLEASIYENIAKVFNAQNDTKSASEYLNKALEIRKKEDDRSSLAAIFNTSGKFYYDHSKTDQSIPYFKKAEFISREIGAIGLQKDAFENLSRAYEKKHQYDSSLFYFQHFIAMRDSIYNKEREKEITRKKLLIDFGIKENEYKLTRKLIEDSLSRQVLLAGQQQQLLALNAQRLKLSDQEKNLQKLTFLQRQSQLENEKKSEEDKNFKQVLKSRYENRIRDKQISNQRIELSYNRKVNQYLLGLGLIILCATGFIFSSMRKTVKLNKLVSQQKEELQELNNVKDKIFSIISHDMRSPVNQLISFTNLLEITDVPRDKIITYAGQLKNNLSYTSNLLENLLKWSSSQMQGFKPDMKKVDVGEIVSDIVKSMAPLAAQKNIIIENKTDHNHVLYCDKDMTALIVRNLLSNAIKYTQDKGTISLDYYEDASVGGITITDSGVGISPEKINLINNPKPHSIKSSYGTKNEKGTGLGLLLCKTFAGMMKGNLHAGCVNGHGTTFTVKLNKDPLVA